MHCKLVDFGVSVVNMFSSIGSTTRLTVADVLLLVQGRRTRQSLYKSTFDTSIKTIFYSSNSTWLLMQKQMPVAWMAIA